VKKQAKNHPADDTLARPLLQIRHLEMNNSTKKKKTKKNKYTSHHSPKRLGEDQPPPNLAGGNKSSTTLEVGRKNNPTEPTQGERKIP